jgi:hypothetical protein
MLCGIRGIAFTNMKVKGTGKCKVISVLKELSIRPQWLMEEWGCSSTILDLWPR